MNKGLKSAAPKKMALWKVGYRVFFFFAAVSGVILTGFWALVYATHLSPTNYYEPIGWHSHEMMFGFGMAVVAGYLLTVTEVWSKIRINPATLRLLALIWVAGRVMPLVPGLPGWSIAAVDLLFIPMLAWVIVPRFVSKVRSLYNTAFILLWLMTLANAFIHGQILGVWAHSAEAGQAMMIYLILALLVVVGRRLSPDSVTETAGEIRLTWLSVAAVAVFAMVDLGTVNREAMAAAAAVAVGIFAMRLLWWAKLNNTMPMKWAYVNAYLWMMIGFVLYGMNAFELVSHKLALHAFTVGGIGVMTITMMMHMGPQIKGRLHNKPSIVLVVVAVNLAALTRVFVPMFTEKTYSGLILVSSFFWVLAFTILFFRLAPKWVYSRDGDGGFALSKPETVV